MFAAHVPIDRRRAIARGTVLPERCRGAALFADVTGFSGLASRLEEAFGSKRAAEELLIRINRIHSLLVRQVHAYAGSVIAFAGDSVTCWFDDLPFEHAVEVSGSRRAVACALAMQRGFAGGASEPEVMSLKVAVASGSARRLLIGDPKVRLVDTLAGRTIAIMARAERHAAAGEVVVTREVAEQVGASRTSPKDDRGELLVLAGLDVLPGETPWPAAEEPTFDARALQSWVPSALGARLQSEPSFADLRSVVPVFVAFEGIDYDDDPDAGRTLDRLVRAVQVSFDRSGGSLLDLTIGDKGSYLYGVVGAPVAQPDAVRRAAAIARELRALPAAIAPSQLRLGMTYGRAWSGVIGSPERAAYAVMGDVVNFAARLMQAAAPGEVLVSAAFSAAAPGAGAAPRGEISIKGKSAPVSVFSLEARGQSLAAPAPSGATFVGRTSELGKLDALIEDARAGRSGVFFVEAAAGLGKTKLAAAMLSRARAAGVRTLSSAGDAVERDNPFRAWRGPFHELLAIEPGDANAAAHTLARAAEIAPDMADRMPLLGPVVGLALPENELLRWMTDEVRADNTREIAVRLLSSTKDRTTPLLVLLDDAQWIDTASWALARRLIQEVQGVVLVVLARPRESGEPAPSDDEAKLFEGSAARVVLSGLSDEDTLAVACTRLGVSRVPERLAQFLVTRTAGHPLLADVLAASLLESGQVSVAGNECTLAESFDEATIDLPGTVEGLIGERLDRLEPSELGVLGRASVLGAHFDAEALAAVVTGERASSADDLDRAIDHLTARDLLEWRDGELAFRHALVRDVAYGRLLFATKRELHRAAAAHLSARHAADLGPWHVTLAYHYVGAEEGTRAADHFGAAGEAALRAGAFRETTVFLERALALAPPSVPEAVRAHHKRRIANALYRLGDLPRSTERAEEAVRVFDKEVPKAGAKLVSGIVGELATQVVHRFVPSRAAASSSSSRRDEMRTAVSLYQNLSEVYYLGGLQGPSIYAALRQVNVAERAGPSEELAEAYAVLSIIAGVVGQRALCRRYEALSEGVVAGLANPRSRAMLCHQRSLSGAAFGEFDKVERDETDAAATFEKLGEIGRRRDALGLLGTTQYLASRYADAERTLETLLATRTGDDRFVQEIWGTGWLGAIALVRGRLPEAVRLLSRSVALLDRNTVGLMEISCVGMLGSALLRQSDPAGWMHIDRAFELIERAKGRPTGHISLDGYVAVADAYLAAAFEGRAAGADPRRARARAEQACRWLEGFGRLFPIARPAACLAGGRLARGSGRSRAAQRSFEEGLVAARALGMVTEEGRLLLALSGVAPAKDAPGLAASGLAKLRSVGAEIHAREASVAD